MRSPPPPIYTLSPEKQKCARIEKLHHESKADSDPFNRYLVDAFTVFAASSLAANTVVRSVAGAVLPLAGLSMYDALGLGWGNSLLGFIALALAPLPFWISK